MIYSHLKLFLCTFIVFCTTLTAGEPKLHICTVASKNTKTLDQLLHSCQVYKIKIDVMGLNLPYKGNGQKLTYIKNYIKNMPKDDIVLFVDAYDTLFFSSEQKILDKFYALNTQCVFGAETQLSPIHLENLRSKFPKSPNKFIYLNSGTFIGYVGYVKKMLDDMSPIKEDASDQGQLIHYYLKHKDEIVLDYYCNLFFTLHKISDSEYKINLQKKNVTCLITNTEPCVIHGNGNGKAAYQKMFDTIFK